MRVTTFIESEYLMAYGLMKKLRNGMNAITFSELRQMARQLQDELNNSGIDAVVLTNFNSALDFWSKYFSAIKVNGVYYVKCTSQIGLYNLERRFIGYLPLDVLKIMIQLWL